MSKQRAKGTAAESAVVDYMKANGWPHAERHAQHGFQDVGDINIGPGVVVEVKSVSRHALGEWIAELKYEMDNADGDDGVVVIKKRGTTNPGDWYALMTFGQWCQMAKESGL